jgi:aryl-alcohol dehydrogenase-like predicted oxidoreductase
MEYTHLGRSGLSVSRLCLGTMNFGPLTPPADAHAIMDHAHAIGINFFDTANRYGGRQSPPGQITTDDQSHPGWTEEIIGDWFAGGNARRERTVLATKLYGAMSEWPNDGKLSALNIRRACEASLRRLQTDYIDLYQMHHVDRDTPWDEIWQAMELLVQEGKVLYVGSSNFAAWNIVQANEAARQRHFLGLVSEQSHYNLATRLVELEVVPACRAYGVGIIPWSPLGGGLLGGVLAKAAAGRRADDRIQKLVAKHRPALEAYERVCAELGQKPARVGLAWLLHMPGVTAPIVGPRTMEQLEDAVAAEQLVLDADVMKKLDAIWPGPGGQAPEAYAW